MVARHVTQGAPMSDLFEDPASETGQIGGQNAPAFTVSELAGAVKRVIEGEFGLVRVRGEVSRVSRPASGHLYFDLKDDRASIAAIIWKGQASKLKIRPEEGIEVVVTGRMTTFPGQSKYQLIIEDVAPAGMGALMLMLEKRRAALAAEGLFDEGRKQPIPYLPGVIGVVTSPSGAVIRDILHRLRDRFPSRVVIWPVAVQGEKCASEVAATIRGFNALLPGGPVPRPDLIIVARGGGSIEDLWGFNEEVVVRAAAESRIPLISAVGHETDTTLLDHAADRRAPTPTAAAEMAVPVRIDLLAWATESQARLVRAVAQATVQRRQRLRDLARALPRPETLLTGPRQRFDQWSDRLPAALRTAATRKRAAFSGLAALVRADLLTRFIAREQQRLAERFARALPALERSYSLRSRDIQRLAARLQPDMLTRDQDQRHRNLDRLSQRFSAATAAQIALWRARLDATERLRQTLGYQQTLKRGYAVVRGDGHVMQSRAEAEAASALELEFHDGRLPLSPRGPRKGTRPAPDQGSLF